jgi:nitrite reductase/ring-hydroxylating ferredoxin subunit
MAVKLFPGFAEAEKAVSKGSMKLLLIRGKSYNLIHTERGLVVTNNLCPHMHEPLHKGTLNSINEVICPLHHYRFNLTTGQEANNRCNNLRIYPILINETGVYIEL